MERLVKVVLIGSIGVGKTSILKRLIDNQICTNEKSTIGIDFQIHVIGSIKFHIWDTAGQERFKGVAKQYYRGANVILFVYDVTNKASFDGMSSWIEEVGEPRGIRRDYLIANKCDNDGARCVHHYDGLVQAEEYGMQYVETSAKHGTTIADLFDRIAGSCSNDPIDDKPDTNILLLEPIEATKRKCC